MPSYGTTTLNGLRWLTGANPVQDIDAGFQALAEDVDLHSGAYGTLEGLGPGVSAYGDCRVTQKAGGANMSVDVAAGPAAIVTGGRPGTIDVAATNLTIAPADATNPRIDIVVLEPDATPARVITGTPTAGATLDNRNGAAATPSPGLLVADVLVAAAASSIANAAIRDRRAIGVGVPPLLTAVDMVSLEFVGVAPTSFQIGTAGDAMTTNRQAAALVRCPRRIVGATKIRWRYRQSATAWTGNYVLGLFDASGRSIVDTGSVAATGALNTHQVRSETITATTLEAGLYYAFIGVTVSAGAADLWGARLNQLAGDVTGPLAPNIGLRSTTGGVTVPQTILGLGDVAGLTSDTAQGVPQLALSVG
jgi:hypothetical protein